MINRIKGALLLDVGTFEEIEHDEKATGQAALVVIIVSILAAIGISIGPVILQPDNSGSSSLIVNFIVIAVGAIIAWLVWSAVTYIIGAKIFDGEATYGEMLRVTGFGFAPMAFLVLSAIPCIGFAIALIVFVWSLGAVFIAVRSGLDLDFGRTLITVIVGWLVYAIAMGIIFTTFIDVTSLF